jgi:hypothetical protein
MNFQQAGREHVSLPAFSLADLGKIRGNEPFTGPNKYNPIYNLQTMIGDAKNATLKPRGNLMNKKDESRHVNKDKLSTRGQTGFYEIHVKGQLDESWSEWLEGLEVKLLDNGEMILAGHIRDQAALMGILNKLYGLNLTLLSVSEVEQEE